MFDHLLKTLISAALLAVAPAERGGSRFIPPEASTVLGDALDRLAPDWEWENAAVERNRVEGAVCQPGGEHCYGFRLTDPEPACSGRRTGPWCLAFEGNPPEGLEEAMAGVLSPMSAGEVWYAPAAAADVPASAAVETASDPDTPPPFFARYLLPWLLALALLVLPALAGFFSGVALRRCAGGRLGSGPAAAALFLAPPVLACLLPPYLLRIGFWDLLLAALSLGGGLALGVARPFSRLGRRTAVLACAAALLGLVVLEAGSRLLPPVPYSFYPPWKVAFRIPTNQGVPPYPTIQTDALYPRVDPAFMVTRTAVAEGARRTVLHVGDSMVHGTTLGLQHTFPSLLTALDPGTAHLNAGVPGTGPDYYYQLVFNWLEHMQVELVVVHLFAGGDLADMDRPYVFCRNGPLLDYPAEGPRPRCPAPDPGGMESLSRWFSPAPYLFRVAADCSAAARHLSALLYRLPGTWNLRLRGRRQAAHLEQLLRSLAARLNQRGVGLLVVVLPHRLALEEGGKGRRRRSTELVDIAERAGVPVLDAYSPLAAGAKEHGVEHLFLPEVPGDVHFSAVGHRLLAQWLVREMKAPAGLEGPRETAQPRREP